MIEQKSYRVSLNEDWELRDLYEFPHALSQCYSFIYCLDSELQPRDRERIKFAMQEYPWRGGYSYVNIYTVFANQIHGTDRPKIKSIQKASPGWLDLLLNVNVAYQIAGALSVLSGAVVSAIAAYKKANQLLIAINTARRKANTDTFEATADQLKHVNAMCLELAKFLGFKSLKELHEHTGDPEVSLKLLMAHYRRMSVLLDYAEKGKATLSLPPPPQGR